MTLHSPDRIGRPEDFGVDRALLEARMVEAERSHDYFMTHAEQLFEQYPNQWLLIYSGGQVIASEHLSELIDRRAAFDDITRGGAIIERRRTGVWIL